MRTIAEKIKNSSLLTEIFGGWPSFHDAEVISVELIRNFAESGEPALRASIHVFEMTSEVDAQGYYVFKNHVVVGLLFSGIDEVTMNGFNRQNALWDLEIQDISSQQLENLQFEVDFPSSFGLEAEFKCREIKVESVERVTLLEDGSLPRQSPPKAGAHNT